jgi:hypothetical protein
MKIISHPASEAKYQGIEIFLENRPKQILNQLIYSLILFIERYTASF